MDFVNESCDLTEEVENWRKVIVTAGVKVDS